MGWIGEHRHNFQHPGSWNLHLEIQGDTPMSTMNNVASGHRRRVRRVLDSQKAHLM